MWHHYIMRLCDTDFSKSLNKAFGAPREGIRRHRIFGLAIFDLITTLIGAALISWVFNIRFLYTLVGVFLVGIVVHWMFCVDTTLNMTLGKLFGQTPI
jgi:hypothetical protein